MLVSLLLSGIYFVGVLLGLVLIAFANAKWETDMSPELSLLSWIIVAYIVLVIVTSPLGNLYYWLYDKFKKRFKTEELNKKV